MTMTATGSLRFARHQLVLWRRTWYGSAFSTLIAPVLYLASIGLGLGSLIEGGGSNDALGGVSYAAFAGTGLMAGSAMQTGAGDMAWPVVGSIKYTRTWIAAIATPLTPGDLLGGKILMLILRLTVSSAVFAAALALFGLVSPLGALAAIPPAVLVGVAIGPSLFAIAAGIEDDYTMAAVFRFGINPLFILSGTFFPIDQLPAFVQPVALLSPLWHGVELLRAAALGLPTDLHPAGHVLVLVVWGAVGTVVAMRMLGRRLQP